MSNTPPSPCFFNKRMTCKLSIHIKARGRLVLHLRWHKVNNHGTCKVVCETSKKNQIYGMVQSFLFSKNNNKGFSNHVSFFGPDFKMRSSQNRSRQKQHCAALSSLFLLDVRLTRNSNNKVQCYCSNTCCSVGTRAYDEARYVFPPHSPCIMARNKRNTELSPSFVGDSLISDEAPLGPALGGRRVFHFRRHHADGHGVQERGRVVVVVAVVAVWEMM